MIKVLGIETHYRSPDGTEKLSAVDWWRVVNPLKAVSKKYKDIQVTLIRKIINENNSVNEVFDEVGKNYDILWSSYLDTPKSYSWIKAVCHKYKMKHIMDLDDDIFNVDNMNPAYIKYYPGSEGLKNASIIIADVPDMVVSTKHLQAVVSSHRSKKPVVLENYISDKVYVYDKDKIEKHDGIYIGYQGSATHFNDFMKTGILYALRRILHEYPQTKFYMVGMAFEEITRILPKDQVIIGESQRDHRKWRKNWQKMPIDIGIAPLVDSSFNRGKSSIKYYEYALRKIPGVYSWVEPYINVVKENETGYLAKSEIEWYEKIKYLLDDNHRNKIAENAYKDVLKNYTIEKHVDKIADFIRKVHESKR